MTRPDEEFDAQLRSLFADAGPPAQDPEFAGRVMARLPHLERWRAAAVTAAALAGAAVASVQAAPLVSGLAVVLEDAGALAAGAFSGQAIVMAAAGAAALGLALLLSWREPGLR